MREAKSDVVGKQVVEVCPLSIFYLYIVITVRDIINLMEKKTGVSFSRHFIDKFVQPGGRLVFCSKCDLANDITIRAIFPLSSCSANRAILVA